VSQLLAQPRQFATSGRRRTERGRGETVRAVTVYMTVEEVAQLARCEHRSVRRAIQSGRLQAFRPARRILVREDDARAWIESRPALLTSPQPPRRQRVTRTAGGPGSVARLKAIEVGGR
jgi:excisionase family DNA binding protein